MADVARHQKFTCVEFVGENHNKFWNITEYKDGSILVEFGRVGKTAQSKLHPAGHKNFDSLVRSKLRGKSGKPGYKENRVLATTDNDRGRSSPIHKGNLRAIAKKQIKTNSTVVEKLIEKLIIANVHNILAASSGSITYDTSTAQFKTPQGIIVPDQVDEARKILSTLADLVNDELWDTNRFARQLTEYLHLIPHNLGMRRIEPKSVLPDFTAVQKENDLLDGLAASFIDVQNTPTKKKGKKADTEPSVFDVELIFIKDAKTISWVKNKFHKTKKMHQHLNCRGLDVKVVYKVVIRNMASAFEKYGAKLTNIQKLWHGTKVSNVLSILKQGLIIPPSSSSHCTGRMYGNGLYFSSISTKALNYATNFWGGGGSTSAYFMFLRINLEIKK